MTKTVRLTVAISVDDDVRAEDVRGYVSDAVASHGGAFEKDHPFFDLKKRARVTLHRRRKTPGAL